jgi:tetratricopeptide (TPR) repeat protein
MQTSCARIAIFIATFYGVLAGGQPAPETGSSPPPANILQLLPMDSAAVANLQKLLSGRDYTAAEQLLAEAAGAHPDSQPVLIVLANVLFLHGNPANCAIVLKKAELLAPLDERSRFLLTLSYIAMNRRKLAIPELEKLMAANPSNAVYSYWLSRLHLKTDPRRALQYAEAAVRVDAKFMKAHDQLGLCYGALNRTDDAIRAYQEAIRLNREQTSKWPWPSLNLGTLLIRLERFDGAEAALREALAIDPQFPVAHLRLGRVLERKGLQEEAIAQLKEAVRWDPTYPEPHYALSRIYRTRKDVGMAQEEIALFQKLREVDKAKGITRPD